MIPTFLLTAIAADAGCVAKLDTNPTRFWAFGESKQPPVYPYATWQLITGTPESLLSETPPCDSYRVQIDVWAQSAVSADQTATAIRDCLQTRGALLQFSTSKDLDLVNTFRVSMDWLFWQNR